MQSPRGDVYVIRSKSSAAPAVTFAVVHPSEGATTRSKSAQNASSRPTQKPEGAASPPPASWTLPSAANASLVESVGAAASAAPSDPADDPPAFTSAILASRSSLPAPPPPPPLPPPPASVAVLESSKASPEQALITKNNEPAAAATPRSIPASLTRRTRGKSAYKVIASRSFVDPFSLGSCKRRGFCPQRLRFLIRPRGFGLVVFGKRAS